MMFNLYHNLTTADEIRVDGAGHTRVIADAFKMWKEEHKAIVLQTEVLADDGDTYYKPNGETIVEDIVLVGADGKITPKIVHEAAQGVRRLLHNLTYNNDAILCAAGLMAVDAALSLDIEKFPLENQLQRVIDCLYPSK